jgi:hypothetical protein
MTYQQIQFVYKCKFGKTIKSCWIADVKRQIGFDVRVAYNRKGTTIIHRCPPNLIETIKGIINGVISCP